MSLRAGILVTGTEVLSGRVSDRNGPWLAERLDELGVDLALTEIVGDRPRDILEALRWMTERGLDLVITSGGLGPTADDLTARVVGEFQRRPMVLDEALRERIAEILRPLASRWPNVDMQAVSVANAKQATIPEGATVLEPVGTAPGLVVPPAPGHAGPVVLVLPGPPRELQPMWEQALKTETLAGALAGAVPYLRARMLLFGIPESELAKTLREAEGEAVRLERLEITTCLHRGELDITTRSRPDAAEEYARFAAFIAAKHPRELFSNDGRSLDERVADLLREHALTIATAESCTGGMLVARLTDPPGASRYVRGGLVAYSDEIKVERGGVDRELIERHGAVSTAVAQALAGGACTRFDADVGVGVTGIAGPGGGSESKPVGLVCFAVADRSGVGLTRSVNLPGGRADVRDRATTVALHLVRRMLLGESDQQAAMGARPQT
jgi:nicotinamide-nucleotide amidase